MQARTGEAEQLVARAWCADTIIASAPFASPGVIEPSRLRLGLPRVSWPGASAPVPLVEAPVPVEPAGGALVAAGVAWGTGV